MRIVAVDPGGTSGIAGYDSAEGSESFFSEEWPTFEALAFVDRMLDRINLVVCEAFIITPATWKKTRAGSYAALESIGALRYLAHDNGVDFELQAPAERDWATNARLKKIGWRNPSRGGHRDDAARHLLVACVRRELIDPQLFIEGGEHGRSE